MWRFFQRTRLARGLLVWARQAQALAAQERYEHDLEGAEEQGAQRGAQTEADKETALEKLRRSFDGKLRKERQVCLLLTPQSPTDTTVSSHGQPWPSLAHLRLTSGLPPAYLRLTSGSPPAYLRLTSGLPFPPRLACCSPPT